MSHVATIDLEIKDLESLKKAAEECGLEFRTDQKKYNWWGRSVGDYPLPEGFRAEDLGKCDHALSVKGKPSAYEVGVVKRKDGKPGYQLLWDFYGGGKGLEAAVGQGASKLKQEYAVAVAAKQAKRDGYRVKRENVAGKVRLRLTR